MKFTNSPYETMMQQVPRYERPEPVKAPEGSRCHGCPYWRGIGCVLAAGGETVARELTREEKAAIRKLVTRLCANYDRDVGCLPLDCPCYMLEKCWTGALCRYFREAVLPNDPVLEASLAAEGPVPETRPCPICGRAFLPDGRTRYCSPGCAKAALRQQKRNYMRKKRS